MLGSGLAAVCWRGAVLAAVVGLCLATSPGRLLAQPTYPFDKTEHGGRDVNHDGTTGALRPPNTPVGGYTINPTQFGAGQCIQCHDQHGSLNGVSHPPNSPLVFQAPENRLCASCHDRANSTSFNLPWYDGWADTQRSAAYAASKHGSLSSGAQWVAGNSYGNIANVLNANLATPGIPPGAARLYDRGSCLTCHSSHGFNPNVSALVTPAEQSDGVIHHMLNRTMGSQTGAAPAESNALCNYCHDNTTLFGPGTDHNLASSSYWYKGSKGVGTTYSGYLSTPHATSTSPWNLFPGSTDYPARTGEKGLCLNCHDPHGGAPAGNIGGAPGGSAPSNRMLVAPMIDPNQPTVRNQLCYTCHNQIGTSGVQGFEGQTLYQSVQHGISLDAWWGRTTDPYDGSPTDYNAATAYWGPRASSDYGLCLNCHNPHTETIAPVSVNGTNVIPDLLIDTYDNGNSTTVTSYDPNNFRLCLDCHNEPRLTSSSSMSTTFRSSDENLHALQK
ncbi:MAG: cytochrome c3 family protein [Armatimonadetes bacterium]|nr:cytochrome c3 family protein [Armatimonadota bacterium]